MLGLDQLSRLVAIELHAVEFAQQVIGEFNIGLVDFINQQCHWLVGGKCLPEHTLDDVIADILDALAAFLVAQLAVTQTTYRVIFV
ncbi:hypothetical protein SDC9_80740 [bioreactor metagenome]|uniref:Uncharacterized protein n=1 Tax=bioreactor metagenome TaxID=1076179 RepID=A0A644Z1I1_9ZZZZ